jgi:hypothetical protein
VKVDIKHYAQFEIIKFLYQFKDDNKFYKLEEGLLNIQSQREIYTFLYNLRNSAFIGTDCELYHNDKGEYFVEHFSNINEIRARILPKGIAAIESLTEKD